MKSKIKKLKEHSCIEYQFTYTFNGEVIKRKVRLIDGRFDRCDGFVTSKELDCIKQIIEEHFG